MIYRLILKKKFELNFLPQELKQIETNFENYSSQNLKKLYLINHDIQYIRKMVKNITLDKIFTFYTTIV